MSFSAALFLLHVPVVSFLYFLVCLDFPAPLGAKTILMSYFCAATLRFSPALAVFLFLSLSDFFFSNRDTVSSGVNY